MRAGREFPILRDGKVVAKVVPVAREPRKPGRFAHLSGNLPSDVFDHPLSETELQSWEGKHSFDGGK
ncbi:MAG: prevent-host-death protein [Hoeflea sp.]|nr:prevent-host-death protein [Alphaproteobacteria bacterium]MBV1722170.1 prevent-host-death protein [Hoeflea sp.]MBU4544838.1 prevent-host-death protein [Alphaproteobacteria bacterium]MBU4551981.1 prevent-host-death protein [Alphaproteobacteria bacterium]MBV1761732.1 prevent-host-death protein [Hoeflea sp.]